MTQGEGTGRLSRRRALLMAAGTAGAAAVGAISVKESAAQASQQAGGAGGGYYGSMQGVEGIVVTGMGQASGDVSGGVLQYVLRYSYDAPQVTGSGSGGSDAKGGSMTPAPDDDAMAKVVAALVDGGIPKADIKTFPGSDTMYGPFGSGVSVVGASISDAALLPDLDAIVQAGADAAAETNLQIDQIGAVFITDDCEAVSDDALAAAVTDAQKQAEALAKALRVELGDMTGATSSPPYSIYSGYDYGASGCASIPDLEDAGRYYFPTYLAGSDPQFTMTASVTLTFALGTAGA